MGLIFEVDLNSNFLLSKYPNSLSESKFKKVAKLFNIDIANMSFDSSLIPIWKLFKIQLELYPNQVFKNTDRLKPNFLDFQDCFKEVFTLSENKSLNIDTNKYQEFFKYLINIHYEFKMHQQYKLMWNLESLFISKTANILNNNGVPFSKLNEITMHREISYLYTIYKSDEFDFFEKHYHYFINENNDFSKFVKNELKLDKKSILKLLFTNKDYYITLHTIIELNNRWKQNKYNGFILISLIRGIILNVESLIKKSIFYIKDNNILISDNIENKRTSIKKNKDKNKFDSKFKSGSLKLSDYIKFLSNKKYFDAFDENFRKYEDEAFFDILDISKLYLFTIEKNLFIFYKVRNYIAHNHLDFEKFFEEESIRLNEVIESVIFILIYLEYLKQK